MIFLYLLLYIIGLKTAKHVYARKSTTTLVALNSLLKWAMMGQYIPQSLQAIHWGLVDTIFGSQVYQLCFNFLSPYKGCSSIQNPFSICLRDPQHIMKNNARNTTRMYLFYHWEQWRYTMRNPPKVRLHWLFL